MRTVKAGAVLLSVWSGLNLLLAAGILVAMVGFGRNAPSLSIVFQPAEIAALDGRAVALVNALAVLFNGCAIAFCLLVLVVTWIAVVGERARWAFLALLLSTGPLQLCGFLSDARLGHRNLVANAVSTAVLVAGLVLVRPRPR